jgi:hypothetical protein
MAQNSVIRVFLFPVDNPPAGAVICFAAHSKFNPSNTMFYPSLIGYPGGYALSTATAAENTAREAQTKTELTQHDIDRLLLITEALWTLMKQEHGYTDDKLVKLIQDIDHRKTNAQGVAVKDPPVACPVCGRPNTASRIACLYCGSRLPANLFAR